MDMMDMVFFYKRKSGNHNKQQSEGQMQSLTCRCLFRLQEERKIISLWIILTCIVAADFVTV